MRTVQNLPYSPATQPYNNQNKPFNGNYEVNQPFMSNGTQPVTPTPNYGVNQECPNPVTPPGQFTQNIGTREAEVAPVANRDVSLFNAEEDDLFGVPPMGTPVQGGGLPQVPQGTTRPAPDNQYQGVVNGMASLSVRPGAPQPFAEARPQPYSAQPSYPPQVSTYLQQPANGNGYMANQGYWQSPQSQPYQHYQSTPTSPNQLPEWGQPPSNQLPSWGAQPAPVPHSYEQCTHQNSQGAEEHKSLDDHKRSVDLIREQGAGLRALRLLDETTKNDFDPYGEHPVEPTPRRGGIGSVKKAAIKEMAKNQNAKQLRKMKRLEYKNKKTEMLAESSRTVSSVRRGFDPELTSDKCQLDFDRQRDAQIKALRLINSNIF
ncbi:expressed unknown protein [Seminavis robusta]|uniref:Uncharacterized protein n=1 Tax=Seminavis robusta TaxID=568900 RepID=A0A9N8HBX6_9STRA|nr:expressed unknown protein [Seminavis robusta]|eukprot:Sro355_g125130.1 n/a (375) ;mRNA; f:43960-45084